jgi:hypothetical protein
MPLHVDLIAPAFGIGALEEVVEADLIEGGGRCIGRDVAPDPVVLLVRPHHHHRCVPSDDAPDRKLDLFVAGEVRFLLGGDRVDVVGRDHGRKPYLAAAGVGHHLVQQIAGPGGRGVDEQIERLDPFLRLVGIDVGKLVHVGIEHRVSPLFGAWA